MVMGTVMVIFARSARKFWGTFIGYRYGYCYFSREARDFGGGGTVMVMGMVNVIFRAKRAKILRYSYGYRYGYGYILNQNGGTVMGVR